MTNSKDKMSDDARVIVTKLPPPLGAFWAEQAARLVARHGEDVMWMELLAALIRYRDELDEKIVEARAARDAARREREAATVSA